MVVSLSFGILFAKVTFQKNLEVQGIRYRALAN